MLPDILVDKDGWKIMVVSAYIPADGGFGPGFFPFRIIREAEVSPDKGDDDEIDPRWNILKKLK